MWKAETRGKRKLLPSGTDLWQYPQRKTYFYVSAGIFLYIDGVYTIIDMATAYGSALGLDSTGLLLALLVTQLVAFPCAILFGKLSGRMETCRLITVCIFAYLGIAILPYFKEPDSVLDTCGTGWNVSGWNSGVVPFIFYKIIPAEKSGEYFGLMDICGKAHHLWEQRL